jgi:hypothetical protein
VIGARLFTRLVERQPGKASWRRGIPQSAATLLQVSYGGDAHRALLRSGEREEPARLDLNLAKIRITIAGGCQTVARTGRRTHAVRRL